MKLLFTHLVSIGDLVRVNLLGRTIIYVQSWNAAVDLFERRSAIYSDRQDSVLAEL